MEMKDSAVTEKLVNESPRFRKLYEEHALFEKELQQIGSLSRLTAEDEVQRKKIQKLKLAGKDEMERILAEAR